MHRFFVDLLSIQGEHFRSTDADLCHQLSRVLKMTSGEKIMLCDNTECEYEAELMIVNKASCHAKILDKKNKPDISSLRPVHLFVAPLKNQNRWEWMLEKCTEIGVASFTPLITERTEVEGLRKIDRLERIIREAAEQSGRTKMPSIHSPKLFSDILTSHLELGTSNFIATLQPHAKPLHSYQLPATSYQLFIGPVGDFTPAEIQLALEHNFYPVTLGQQVLRTETAAIVASTLVMVES